MCGEHFERRVLTVKCTEPMCCRVSWPQCSPSWSRGGFQLFERLCSALRAGVLRRSSSTTPRITGAVCVVSRLFLIQGTFGCPATESREHQGQAYSFPFPPDKNSSHSWSFGQAYCCTETTSSCRISAASHLSSPAKLGCVRPMSPCTNSLTYVPASVSRSSR